MTPRSIDIVERRARLALRHRHVASERTDDVVAVTDSLLALHSTDPVSVYLSAAARMTTPALAPLDEALYERRMLLRHHAMRRTLWVFGPAAARLAHHGATAAVARTERRKTVGFLDAAGVAAADAWLAGAMDEVEALLVSSGPLTAREVGARLPVLAVPLTLGGGRNVGTQSAHSRVLLQLGFEGRVLRTRPTGTWINGQYTWAAASTWFPGAFEPLPEREAVSGLARRWLAAFGPGTTTDLQWWAGWTVTATRRALADVGAVEVVLDEGPGWVLPEDVDPAPPAPPSAVLLPGLDPSTMGWKQRGFHLDADDASLLFDRYGNGGPTAWVDGRVAGGWHQRADGTIALHVTRDVGAEAHAALQVRAGELEKLLGEVRFRVRFPSPVQTRLA